MGDWLFSEVRVSQADPTWHLSSLPPRDLPKQHDLNKKAPSVYVFPEAWATVLHWDRR